MEYFQEFQKDVCFSHVCTNYPKHKLTTEKKLLRLQIQFQAENGTTIM